MQHSTKDAKSEILNETHLKESSEQERLSRLGHLSERELVQPIESNMLDARAHYSSSSGSLSSHTFGRLDQRTKISATNIFHKVTYNYSKRRFDFDQDFPNPQ